MGHLLSTVNPEAAAAIKPEEPFKGREPYVGEIVQYWARAGERPWGRLCFPAIVMDFKPVSENPRGIATLMVLYGAEDHRNYDVVMHRSPENPTHAWDFPPVRQDNEQDIARLCETIFGDEKRREESVYGMLKIVDSRLRRIETRLKLRGTPTDDGDDDE